MGNHIWSRICNHYIKTARLNSRRHGSVLHRLGEPPHKRPNWGRHPADPPRQGVHDVYNNVERRGITQVAEGNGFEIRQAEQSAPGLESLMPRHLPFRVENDVRKHII